MRKKYKKKYKQLKSLLYYHNKENFNFYNHFKVVLNHPIDPMYNFPQKILTRVINTNEELKYL